MKYDFTSILERAGKDAFAIDGIGKFPEFAPEQPDKGFDIIPMWVADMNFPTVPTVISSISERLKHPHFGYFLKREEYFQAIIDWHKNRHGTNDLSKEFIGYENGVLGGVITALNVFCSKGDKVLVHSPTYIGFTHILENNGYKIIHSDLKKDEKGIYRMDFEDMEKKIKEHKIHATIFCSPHNPCGRVWEKEEIVKAMEIFEKYNVYIAADEIWSDLILYNNKHTPTQSVSDYAKNHTVAFYAPSKTFNLSGLIGSYHIIYNKYLRDRVEKESSLCHYNDINMLSMYALIGAFSKEGQEWVKELNQVLTGNVEYAINYIKDHFKGVTSTHPEGTYMLFIDCTDWCKEHNKKIEDVEKAAWKVGVAIQDGKMFHGPCHLRANLALPLSRVKEAFDRLDKYVFNAK
jgi:cystathionine beta-lyase